MLKKITEIIFSNCPKMGNIKTIINEVAKTDLTVLIKGESGSGKELVAQDIHLSSLRRSKPFVRVNCAAIPANLLESELFGFEKGAFTGAHQKKPGKFEMAQGGTVLLNDIEEMELSVQPKLLQLLQDGSFSRLGGNTEVPVDVRVIVTTKNHLERSVTEGRFREDLFFRINVIHITLPPLRERIEQIVPLAQYFYEHYRKRYGKEVPPLSSELLSAFQAYSWPGNIRELENFVKRVVLLGEEESVLQFFDEKRLGERLVQENGRPTSSGIPSPGWIFNLREVGRRAVEKAEKELIEATLQKTRWNRKEAAKLLQVSYKALHYKMQRYRLNGGVAIEGNWDQNHREDKPLAAEEESGQRTD